MLIFFLIIVDCLTDNSSLVTFRSLRPRFINLLINALRTENDSTNAQLLIVSLLTSVQDFVTRELNSGNLADISPSGNYFRDKSWDDNGIGFFSKSCDDDLGREGIPGTFWVILMLIPFSMILLF